MTIKFKPNYAIGSEYSSVVTTVPHSKYLLYNYTYVQQGSTSTLSQSGGQALSIMPYDMASKAMQYYYGSNALSESVKPFCMFFGNRHEGSYYRAIVVTNFVAKQGYAFSVTGTGAQVADGLSMQTDGYSDKFFYIYALKRSTFTVDGVQTESNLVDKVIGKYRISDIEDNINYVQDITSFNIVGGSSWVENRLYGTSGLCTANIPKATPGRSRIPISELKYFKQKQDAYNQSVLLMRSGITNTENYSQLTIGNTTYNLLRADSTISDTQLQSINASKFSGKVPLASMPAAALERVHSVADETARFALTSATVHNGDVVYQQDDHSQYYIVDDTNLNNAAGYKKITKVALQVPWTGLTDKPVYFQPATHSHGNITNDGYLGETANLPLITGIDGAIIASSFGTEANTFCEGNDSRLSDAREPLNHGSDKVTALTGYVKPVTYIDAGSCTISYVTRNTSIAPSYVIKSQSSNKLVTIYPYYMAYSTISYTNSNHGAKPFVGYVLSDSYFISAIVISNLKCSVGDRFRLYRATEERYIDHNGYSTEKFWIYYVESSDTNRVKQIVGQYNISDIETNLSTAVDISSQDLIPNYIFSRDIIYVHNLNGAENFMPISAKGSISVDNTLNEALGKVEVKVADYNKGMSMSGYSTQTKAPITTSDSFKVALGKIEGAYLARKYATASDIDAALFGILPVGAAKIMNLLNSAQTASTELSDFNWNTSMKRTPFISGSLDDGFTFSWEEADWSDSTLKYGVCKAYGDSQQGIRMLTSGDKISYAYKLSDYSGTTGHYATSPYIVALAWLYDNGYIDRVVMPLTVGVGYTQGYIQSGYGGSPAQTYIIPETGHYFEINPSVPNTVFNSFLSPGTRVKCNNEVAPVTRISQRIGYGQSGSQNILSIDDMQILSIAVGTYNVTVEVCFRLATAVVNYMNTAAYQTLNNFTGDNMNLYEFLKNNYGTSKMLALENSSTD